MAATCKILCFPSKIYRGKYWERSILLRTEEENFTTSNSHNCENFSIKNFDLSADIYLLNILKTKLEMIS